MQDQTSDIQSELERKVSDAIAKLERADRSIKKIARAYDAALDLHTLLSRPIKVAVGGEFSSGKSTFVKMLLGQHVVDMQASASAMPTVNFIFGAETTYRAIGVKSSRDITDLNALSEDDFRELECLEVMLDLPFLKQFEIFDTPGTADPSRSIDQLLTVVNEVDFVVWCTNATQAWRESERRMWENLPLELKHRSLLILTHVDLPSIKPSLSRLMKRMKKEAAPLFKKIIAMELLTAASARDEHGKVIDQAGWKTSGGADCLETMAAISSEIRADVFDNVTYDLENKIMPVIANIKTASKTFLSYWSGELSKAKTKLRNADNAKVSLGHLKLLEAALKFLDKTSEPGSVNALNITTRLKEAHDYIGNTLLQENTDINAQESHAVMEQLEWEFQHLDMLTL